MKTPEQLAEDNMKLVPYLVHRYFLNVVLQQFNGDLDEIVSIGNFGLAKACLTYSADKGMFTTYASKCISNEILCSLRKKKVITLSLDGDIHSDSEVALKEFLGYTDMGIEDIPFLLSKEELFQKLRCRIPKAYRDTLDLKLLHPEYTVTEISKIRKVTQSLTSRHLIRIRQELRALLKKGE